MIGEVLDRVRRVYPSADDGAAFRREVACGRVVEVDANHITVAAHSETASAIRTFLAGFVTERNAEARIGDRVSTAE